jgi:hypothetical protein
MVMLAEGVAGLEGVAVLATVPVKLLLLFLIAKNISM